MNTSIRNYTALMILAITMLLHLAAFVHDAHAAPQPSFDIHQALIPAAGLGTRFLPFTKATPKELLPLLNKSAIEYIIQEGIDAGITDFYMITSGNKPTLKQYFDAAPELEQALAAKHNEHLLASINELMERSNVHYVMQDKPLGLGHAILMAEQQVGNHYFGILLPDDIIFADRCALGQLIDIAKKYQASVIAVQEVAPDQVSNYGIVATQKELAPGIFELTGLVEKPKPEAAPSRLAIVGRYVLSPRIFASLAITKPGAGNEIQLTDAINHMLMNGERVLACVVQGDRHDIGVPGGWLRANVYLGLQNPVLAPMLRELLLKSH